MIIRKLMILICIIFLLPLFFHVHQGSASQVVKAVHPLPHVFEKMEKPQFWISKIKNPRHPLLKTEEIQDMNETYLKRRDLYLYNLTELQEELSKEELLAWLKEDWDAFVIPGELRYGTNRRPLGKSFWDGLKDNLNQESLRERNKTSYGLIVKRTDVRVFPTEEQSTATPDQNGFDRFQHSAISPGSLVGIYHVSKDHRWTYVQTQFIRGWIQTKALASAKEKKEALGYLQATEKLVITGSLVKVFGDPTLRQVIFLAQMGNVFPLLSRPVQGGPGEPRYVIRIPVRDDSGQLSFGKGFLPRNSDVHEGFLPYTQENVARQAFRMLHEPYGWGDMFGGRDCSRFIMDVFASFGIVMPRNSTFQAKVGREIGEIDGKEMKEKKIILDQAVPLATVLRLPGHIMLYLGKDGGRYYAIHSIWGIEKEISSNRLLEKIAKVEVSDLSLGESGPHGSLLQRITDARFIGRNGNPP
jgi:hypothetical protein